MFEPVVVGERRRGLLAAIVSALEGALPAGTPARIGQRHAAWDVLLEHLSVTDVRPALRAIATGPGGELAPSAAGNVPFCSAESSAQVAVNMLAPFRTRPGLFGDVQGTLTFERELPVKGVRSRFAPTLDAVFDAQVGTTAIEVKTAEPWRGEPAKDISVQPIASGRTV